jgi:hypothetical protein
VSGIYCEEGIALRVLFSTIGKFSMACRNIFDIVDSVRRWKKVTANKKAGSMKCSPLAKVKGVRS